MAPARHGVLRTCLESEALGEGLECGECGPSTSAAVQGPLTCGDAGVAVGSCADGLRSPGSGCRGGGFPAESSGSGQGAGSTYLCALPGSRG